MNQQNQADFDIITLNSKFTLAEEAVESLSDILELLHEDDLWAGLWQMKAHYEETKNAILFEQQGLFEQAQDSYEMAMNRQRKEFDTTCVLKPGMKSENRLWEKHWIRCTKELNQWDSLLEYGSSKPCSNPMLVLESAWRVPNWPLMREALILVDQNCPPSSMWRLQLYKGYNFICNREKPADLQYVDEAIHIATSYCIQTWKKLPHIITNAHLPLLQAAQQLLELNEAKAMHVSLYCMSRNGNHDLRTILKSWPKRLPILLDDLSHWSDIITWRQHQYQTIVAHFENQVANQVAMGHPGPVCMTDGGPASVAMQGAHFSAQGVISFGTVARKQGLLNVCLDSLNRIHTIPSVPIFDCFHKIRQQIKSYIQMPVSSDQSELLDGLDIIECTNMKYFQKEFISEFYTYKGIFNSRLGRHDEANKAFSCAAQIYDSSPKAWSAWGEYLEKTFTQDFTSSSDGCTIDQNAYANRQMDIGVSAITCLLQACKFYPEPKARKYMAEILWLLSYDNSKGELADMVNRSTGYAREHGIPAVNWIVWIPQILQCLMSNPDSDVMKNLLILIGRSSPQAIYFPVRTLLHTLKLVIASVPNVQMQQQQQQQQQLQHQLQQQHQNSPGIPSTPQPHPGSVTPRPAAVPIAPQPSSIASNIITSPSTPSAMGPMTPTPSTPVTHVASAPNTPARATTPGPSPASVPAPSPAPPSTPAPASTPVLIQQLQQPIKTIPSPGGSNKIPQSPMQNKHPLSPQTGKHSSMDPTKRTRIATISRCNEILRRLFELHPTTLSSLDGITDQLAWMKDYSYEEIQRQFQQALQKCYSSAFENRWNIVEETVSPQTLNFVRKIVQTFGINSSKTPPGPVGFYRTTQDFLAQRNQRAYQDPEFRQTRVRVSADFEESLLPNMKLTALITKLKNWVNILAQKKKTMPSTYLMEDKCRFLSNFSQHTAEVEIPGDALMPKSTQYYVRIARFLPEVKVVEKHNVAARRILIRGHNGKIYPYLVLNDTCLSDSRREERVLQLLRLLNQYLVNRKETGRRYLQFTAQRVVAINPGLRLVEDNTSSLSLTDVLRRRINRGRHVGGELDNDSPIREYYERLMKIQALGGPTTPKNIRDIFTDIQNKMVPRNLLKDWSMNTYTNATDYWVFRSQFTYQLAMACLCEYAFLLTSLTPDSMYIHQDTGCISAAFYKFDQSETIESNSIRKQVPFRLTPNLSELITPIGIDGPFRGALEAVASCLTTPNNRVASIFKAILRDEMLFWYKKGLENLENHKLIEMVNRMVKKIQQRLSEIRGTEERPIDSQVPQLISRATNVDNLSQTDPAWHPWL